MHLTLTAVYSDAYEKKARIKVQSPSLPTFEVLENLQRLHIPF